MGGSVKHLKTRLALGNAGYVLAGVLLNFVVASNAFANRVPSYFLEEQQKAAVQAQLKAGFDLPERRGVLSWKLLAAVKQEKHLPPPGSKWVYVIAPHYPDELKVLNGKRVRMQGYVAPIKPGAVHTEFLLNARTTDCQFCVAGGPESFVHVLASENVKAVSEVVVIEGILELLSKDESGMFYRLREAKQVVVN
jgi:uncharacterized protein